MQIQIKHKNYIHVIIFFIILLISCNDKQNENSKVAKKRNHHLNIPLAGIESMMEANSQKLIQGTDGNIVVCVGEITRKKVDISIKRDDKILDERLISENDQISFDYEGITYTIELRNIKKPLIGVGKAEITIK